MRVTYADCTPGNHVYYGRYLDFLEAARGEFLRHLGLTFLELQKSGRIFPVIEAQLRYRGAARYDDVIAVEVSVVKAEGIRMDFAYRILGPDGTLLVEATTRHVCTSTEDKLQRLPADLLDRLASDHAPDGKSIGA